MSKVSKIRLIVFTLLLLLYSYFAVAYSCELCEMQYGFKFIDFAKDGSILVDGSDVTLFMNIGILLANGAMGFAVFIFCIIFMAVTAAVVMVSILLFHHFALKDTLPYSEEEYKLTKRLYLAALIISMIVGLILTLCLGIIYLIIFTAIWALPTWLFYLRPLYERS
jgi:hypothetical protein